MTKKPGKVRTQRKGGHAGKALSRNINFANSKKGGRPGGNAITK